MRLQIYWMPFTHAVNVSSGSRRRSGRLLLVRAAAAALLAPLLPALGVPPAGFRGVPLDSRSARGKAAPQQQLKQYQTQFPLFSGGRGVVFGLGDACHRLLVVPELGRPEAPPMYTVGRGFGAEVTHRRARRESRGRAVSNLAPE